VETIGGGLYLRPTILTEVTPDMDIMAKETFGPVLPVTLFDSVDEAVALANRGVFGLSAAVIAGTIEEPKRWRSGWRRGRCRSTTGADLDGVGGGEILLQGVRNGPRRGWAIAGCCASSGARR
jgi:acyl-CoA reductase-like NAD-dependent aldehyde dehydrogenase